MEFNSTTGLWALLAIIVALGLLMQLAFEGMILMVGSFVLAALSGGRIRRGELRRFGKTDSPKLNGGTFFYYEGSCCYMYQNYVSLIGMLTVLLMLTLIFGLGVWFHAAA